MIAAAIWVLYRHYNKDPNEGKAKVASGLGEYDDGTVAIEMKDVASVGAAAPHPTVPSVPGTKRRKKPGCRIPYQPLQDRGPPMGQGGGKGGGGQADPGSPFWIGQTVHCTLDFDGNEPDHYGGDEYYEGKILEARAPFKEFKVDIKGRQGYLPAEHVYERGQAPQAVVSDPDGMMGMNDIGPVGMDDNDGD